MQSQCHMRGNGEIYANLQACLNESRHTKVEQSGKRGANMMKNHPRKCSKRDGEEMSKKDHHHEISSKWQDKIVQADSAKAESQRTRKSNQNKWKKKPKGGNTRARGQIDSKESGKSTGKSHRKRRKTFTRQKAQTACKTSGTAQEMHNNQSSENKNGAGSSSCQASETSTNLTRQHRKYGTSQGYSDLHYRKRLSGGEWSPGNANRGDDYDGDRQNRSSGQGAKGKEGDKWSERSSCKQHMQHQHPHRKQNDNSNKKSKRKKKKKKRAPEKKGQWTIKRQKQISLNSLKHTFHKQ